MGFGELHIVSNYFTVALVTLGIAFELIGRKRSNEGAVRYGWNSLRLGFVFAIISVFTGLAAESATKIPSDASLSEMFHKTTAMGFAVFVVIVVAFRMALAKVLNAPEKGAATRGAYLTLQIVTIVLMLVTLVLGTRLVHTYGVGVAPVEKMNALPPTPPQPAGGGIQLDTTHYRP